MTIILIALAALWLICDFIAYKAEQRGKARFQYARRKRPARRRRAAA